MSSTDTRTIQLRRYRIVPDRYDDYLAWWRRNIPGLRARAGFTIEFAYGDAERDEMVWAVSAPGDIEQFTRTEERYMDLPERLSVFEGVAEWVAESHVAFVEDLTGTSQNGAAV